MDKNFIDIDSLVKQRLEGGEQQERSGSWQNMSALLDREMPQVKHAPTVFSGRRLFSAVALLLIVGAAGVGSYKLMTAPGNTADNSTSLADASSTVTGNGTAVVKQGDASDGVAADNGTMGDRHIAGTPETGVVNSPAGSVGANTSSNLPVAANHGATNVNTQNDPATGNTAAINGGNTPGDNSTAANNSVAVALDRNAGNNTHSTHIVNRPAASSENIDNTHNAGAKTTDKNRTENSSSNTRGTHHNNISTEKMAVSSTAPAGVPVFVTKTGTRITGDKLQKLNTDKTKQNATNINMVSANALRNKKVIQRMRLVERFIKTTPSGEGFYKMDTLSVVTLTEELGIITETKVNVPKPHDSNSATNK